MVLDINLGINIASVGALSMDRGKIEGCVDGVGEEYRLFEAPVNDEDVKRLRETMPHL